MLTGKQLLNQPFGMTLFRCCQGLFSLAWIVCTQQLNRDNNVLADKFRSLGSEVTIMAVAGIYRVDSSCHQWYMAAGGRTENACF